MKYMLFLGLIICGYFYIGDVVSSNELIPDDAIRVRVIANSNSEYDQDIKLKVSEVVKDDMYNLLKNTKGTDNAKKVIKNNITYLSNDINDLLVSENYNLGFDINYGKNYFPRKEYKGVVYEEGYYESLVVNIGEGKGDNWWCVLFPPLCLVEAEESDEVEYTTFIKEIMEKYL